MGDGVPVDLMRLCRGIKINIVFLIDIINIRCKWHTCISLFSNKSFTSCSPGAPLTNFDDREGGGGLTEVHILPQKITTSEFVTPKKSLLFLAYP